jgi:hypothetical protein
MATNPVTHPLQLVSTGILTKTTTRRERSSQIRSSKDEMDNRTKAQLLQQLQLMGLQILSEQATKDTPVMRERRLCKMLAAVFLGEIQGSRRLDHNLRILTEERTQQPELLAIAQQLDSFIQNKKLEMIDHLVGGLKNPERSKLEISKELIEAATKDRRHRKKPQGDAQ